MSTPVVPVTSAARGYTRRVLTTLGHSAARARFAMLIGAPEVPLAETALAIAEEEYPELDAAAYVARLDALGREVETRLGTSRSPANALRALRAVLFEEHAFRGNEQDYYDPRNSFLNEVMDRRLGIPITLAILTIEVAHRVGLVLHGVGFPGHFLVKHVLGDRETFLDPFRGGELLTADDCAARLRRTSPERPMHARYLSAVTPRQVIGRMLHNLKKIYVERGDDVRALWVTDRLVLLAPNDPAERRDRGLVEARLGGVAAALGDLEAYLAAVPTAEDAATVRQLADQLRGQAPLLN
jgi:regulator of sirC expression with transglutaminase-like and TPR domain